MLTLRVLRNGWPRLPEWRRARLEGKDLERQDTWALKGKRGPEALKYVLALERGKLTWKSALW